MRFAETHVYSFNRATKQRPRESCLVRDPFSQPEPRGQLYHAETLWWPNGRNPRRLFCANQTAINNYFARANAAHHLHHTQQNAQISIASKHLLSTCLSRACQTSSSLSKRQTMAQFAKLGETCRRDAGDTTTATTLERTFIVSRPETRYRA